MWGHMKTASLYIELYSYLEGFEKIGEDDIYSQIVNEWTNEQVETFVVNVFKNIPNDVYHKTSYYNFYANSTLAGAPYPCSALECRMKNLNDLLRFTALYADKVLIQSPIDKYIENLEAGKMINRFDLAGDIVILLKLKSLVLAGIIGFFSSYVCLCTDCLKKVVTQEKEFQKKLEKISELMYEEASNNIKCKLQRDSDGIAYVSVKGAEKLGFHEQIDVMIYQETKKIKKLLKNKKEVNITKELMYELGIVEYLFAPLINDVFRVQVNEAFMKGSYLTNRPYDAMMISQVRTMGINRDAIQRIKMIENGLFHEIPIIGEIDIDTIIQLRLNDGEAFDAYRSKMNSVLDTFDKLDKNSLTDVQRDIIIPELDSMNQVIYRNRQALIKSLAQDVVLYGGGLGVGIFSGMIPIDYASLVGMIGGISTIADVSDKVRKCVAQDEIKTNSFYFLYKLQGRYKK